MAVNSPRRRWLPATAARPRRLAGLPRLVASAVLLVGTTAQASPCSSLAHARWMLGTWVADGDRLEVHVSDGAERGFRLDFRRAPAP